MTPAENSLRPFDETGSFQKLYGPLQQLALRGAGVTMLSQGVALGVQVIATVVLARLIAPKDFGVVTMVTTFSLLFMSFGISGFNEGVLQREEMDHHLASNLFWINIGLGVLVTMGFAAAGPLLARFFHEPIVAPVSAGLSITIFITSTSVLHLALLKRAMRFALVSVNDVVSRIIAVVVSILLAKAGWGYWALVAGAIVQPLSTSIGAWSLCLWVPSLPRRVTGTSSTIRFAANVYARFSFRYFTRNLDNVLVGWRFNALALGFYKKAYDLFALSANQVTAPLADVALSALSRLSRDHPQLRRKILKSLGVIALIGMGLGADLWLVGKDVIRLLLGARWEESGKIFTFFGPGIGVMLLNSAAGWIHLSIGRPDRWLRWSVVEFAVTTLLFFMALHWGPAGIALAWTASFWILVVPSFWYAGKPIQLGARSVVAAVWRYGLASLLAGCTAAVITGTIFAFTAAETAAQALEHMASVSALFGALYVSAVILLHRGCTPLYELSALLRNAIPGLKSSGLEGALTETGN